MLLLFAIYALNYYSGSLPTETQKFFGNKFWKVYLQHFRNFQNYFSPKISRYTVHIKLRIPGNNFENNIGEEKRIAN